MLGHSAAPGGIPGLSLPLRRIAPVALALLSTAALAAEPPAVRIAVDTSGPTTRLVLTDERPVVNAVTAFSGRLEVLYAEPVRFDPPEGAVRDGILEGWTTRDDRTLVLTTGAGYERYESFELRNPSRLILDLQGTRTAAGISAPEATPERSAKTVVVIDPGHGGAETGAVGPDGLLEKDVALDLARRLKNALQRDPTFSVVLTRDEDRLVPLDDRTAIANHNRADLFVSIHLNASRRKDAFGAETYFLSAKATDDEARNLAGLENAAALGDGASAQELKDRGLDLVLWDLAQNQYLAESSALAEEVQREMNALTGTRDRGVRQAPFRVLMGATMPAILVEVGFITNRDEENRLEDSAYRDRIVEALVRAVRRFQEGLERLAAPGSAPGSR